LSPDRQTSPAHHGTAALAAASACEIDGATAANIKARAHTQDATKRLRRTVRMMADCVARLHGTTMP
jgi:hypothetical protein